MELIIGFLGTLFVLYVLYFFITLIIRVIMGVIKGIINAIFSLFSTRKMSINQIENEKTNFLPLIKEEKKCISTIGIIPYCEQCEHCKDDGKLIFCKKANNKVIGYYVGGEYKYRHFIVNGYKPEWCPLAKGLVIKKDNIKKEKLSDKYVPYVESKKENDGITLTYSVSSYHTDVSGRTILDSVKEAEIVFDDLCVDEEKKKQITDFLNKHCKCSSFYIDENYGIYCVEKEEKEIDIKIITEEESLPEYINFIRVPGYFSISGRNGGKMHGNLKTLKGCPKYVGFGFDCSNNKLENLDYAPEVVNFKEKDEDLTKWEGQKYDKNVSFDCSYNMIKSFKNCPDVKKGSVICDNNELSSFDFLPKISGFLSADDNLFQNINEKNIKGICGCKDLSIKRCDRKINSIKLTKDFLDEAIKKYGEDDFEFITTNAYWGELPTTLQSKNSKIGIKCKKHNFVFETYAEDFMNGDKTCPICKMEKYGFIKHNKDLYDKRTRGNQEKDIYIHSSCMNIQLITKIAEFINNNITPNIYYTYFINEDYTVDIEPGYDYAWKGLNNPYKGITVFVENKNIPVYIKFGDAVVSRFVLSSIAGKEKAESFKGCPKRVFGDFICKNENISSFIDMPLFIGGLFDFSNNSFDDNAWEYARDNIPSEVIGDYKHTNNKFITYRKDLY